MDYYTGTLEADVPGGVIDAEAVYEIDAAWSRNRDRYGMRQILHINDFCLESWTFDGRQQTRATAVALLGEAEVERQEEFALEAWRSTAEQDDADGWADYRHDMAAE
ncbi:hypothetical protein [Paracoccus sp. DMF]|uniref:hypothetical protein n=1 Tax=Paracoccus sp. DMF TaxID=400837 RepID=UPI00110462FB|nr:hypothetical protein [Paracoccus sp. DMF]MCV2449393.1 hypothetical protein [Paracoccus sp. DMF]